MTPPEETFVCPSCGASPCVRFTTFEIKASDPSPVVSYGPWQCLNCKYVEDELAAYRAALATLPQEPSP